MEQSDFVEIDATGRKAALLGLYHDHEIVVLLLDEARRLHGSLARYQIAVVDCEMKRLSASDRATELTRFWTDTFISFTNMGSLLVKWAPVDDAINAAIRSAVATEKQAAAEDAKLGGIDSEFRKFMGDENPPEAEV